MGQQIHPIEALKSIQSMADVALQTDDKGGMRRQLELIAITVLKALPKKTEIR